VKNERGVHFAWRKDSRVQHLALRGPRPEHLATYCNKYWVQEHVLPAWSHAPVPDDERRPCLLCVGWLTRNGASWAPLLEWMVGQGGRIRPNLPKPRYLLAV
jgi:hypothetical protein